MNITPEIIIGSQRKVYCKNCKFDGGFLMNLFGWRWCEVKEPNPYYKESEDAYTEFTGRLAKSGFKYRAIRKIERNSDGNCKNYQRKWYKFWVK